VGGVQGRWSVEGCDSAGCGGAKGSPSLLGVARGTEIEKGSSGKEMSRSSGRKRESPQQSKGGGPSLEERGRERRTAQPSVNGGERFR